MEIAQIIGLLLAVAVQLASTTEAQVPQLTAAEVKSHVGQEVTICGRVVTYDCEQSSGSLLLDLDSPSWASGVTVVVGRQYWDDRGGQQLTNRYLFSQVCARGTVNRATRRYRVVIAGAAKARLTGGFSSPSHAFAPDAAQSCADGVTPPVLVQEVKPSYTREALRHKQEGKVYLEAVVLPDGSVGDVRAVYCLMGKSWRAPDEAA